MRNGSKKGSAIDMHPSQMHISKPSLQGDGVRRWELGEVIRSQLRALIKGISALGAWQATVHRVAKSQTKLKRPSTHSHSLSSFPGAMLIRARHVNQHGEAAIFWRD